MAENEVKAQAVWVIGSAPTCDIRVADPTVSGHHCRVCRRGGQFTIEDLGSTNGTFIDGVRLARNVQTPIQYGAKVMLCGQIEMPWPTSSNSPDVSQTGLGGAVSAAFQTGLGGDVSAASQTGMGSRVSGVYRTGVGSTLAPHPKSDKSQVITIGRAPESNVRIDLPIVSWRHAVITREDGKYFIEDLNSRNGTFLGDMGNRIRRAPLEPTSAIFFGSFKISAAQLLSTEHTVEIGESAFTRIPFKGEVMEIGRDPACDIPLPFPMVSWRHARLTRTPQGFMVEDLGSRNGTYLDGVHIGGRTLVKPGQEIGLGSFRFQLLEGGELARREYYGNVTIEAVDITVHAPGGKQLLNPISLTVFPSELVALMGPAGAGKTTLLKALNGYTAPTDGTVLFNGADLYRYYDRFRQQMGYVPQDDIVHPQLTVRQALYFSARLRTDLTDDEISTRTESVVRDLGIQDKIDDVIGSPERKILSGGQRKRVNIALELITDTPVLFLDEPTSGLSSYDAESVVDLLKNLSKSGKTIITTIHQPSLKVYKQFDDLIMVSRDTGGKPGKMVFFGPAFPDAIQFFNPAASSKTQPAELNPEMLFSGMNTIAPGMRTDSWHQRYQASRYQKEFVANRSGKRPEKSGATGEETARLHFGLRQWVALVKRNVFVKLRDRAQTAVLLAQAPLFALLVVVAIYPIQSPPSTTAGFGDLAEKLPILHFLMVIAAIWFGCNNAARDIVGEWTIYKRERMVTLKLLSYVFSKLTVLFVLCVIQCASLLLVVAAFCKLQSNLGVDFCVLLLASLIGSGLGLFISALARTTESAIALLPIVLLPMIAVGGGMRPIYQMPAAGQMLSLVIPSRWAFEANLLQEAKVPAWGAPKAVPDLACTLIDNSPPPMGEMSMPHGPLAPPPGTSSGNPSLAIQSDVAEGVIPQYTITAKNPEGNQVTCRASADEDFPRANPEAHPVAQRHTLRQSFAVLLAMVIVLVSAVIAMLRKRDGDTQ